MSPAEDPLIERPRSAAIRCPRCHWLRHPVEMIYVPAWGSICAFCVEDIQADKESTG